MKSKVFAVVLAVVMLAVCVGSASAITLTSNLTPDRYAEGSDSAPIKYLNNGEHFTYTFTANNAVGTINWHVTLWDDDDQSNLSNQDFFEEYLLNDDERYQMRVQRGLNNITFTSSSGNTLTVSGTFESSFGYTLGVTVTDVGALSNGSYDSMTQYTLWLQNSSLNYGVNPSPGYSETQPVPLATGNVLPVSPSDLEEGVLAKIAQSANISESEIKFITESDLGAYHEPTNAMRQEAANNSLEYAAKFETVTFAEEGYYLFEVDFPAALVGMNTEELKLSFANAASFSDSSVKSSQFLELMLDRFLAGTELRTMAGDAAKTVPVKALILILANTGGSFTMFALKTILNLLGAAGGCNTGAFISIGLSGLFMVFAVVVMRRRFHR